MYTLTSSSGYASVVRNVSNMLTDQMTKQRFIHSSAVSVQWDGACYNGLSTNIALLVDVDSEEGAYLRPKARSPEKERIEV